LSRDLIDILLPQGRQLKTNAHPLVDITLMKQGDHHLIHLVNISCQAETAYFKAALMSNVEIQVKGNFRSARTVMAGHDLAVSHAGGYSAFTLATLADYELIDVL